MSLESIQRNGHNLELHKGMTVGKYDTPLLLPAQATERMTWIGFTNANADKDRALHGVHFFIDDWLFQRVWHDPARYAELLKQFQAVLTPDFSLFTDYPRAVQIYNHWRKHWLGAYWQSLGMNVIPSICWSDHESYEWCFDGEPTGATVAVSSVGTQKNRQTRALFLDGYREMMERLQPKKILFFGIVPEGCEGNIEAYDAFYTAVNARKLASHAIKE